MRVLVVFLLASFAAMAVEIPKAAVQTGPGVYSYTDAKGKKWIYRTTPFGVARVEDVPARMLVAPEPEASAIKAFDAGEFVRFERQGPFGAYKWQTRKSELTADERAAWEKSQARKD